MNILRMTVSFADAETDAPRAIAEFDSANQTVAVKGKIYPAELEIMQGLVWRARKCGRYDHGVSAKPKS